MTVRVTPKAGRDAIDGYGDGVLRLRVSAAPAGGKANDAVVRLIAKALGLAPSRLTVVNGAASRTKVIEIDGMPASEAQSMLARAAENP